MSIDTDDAVALAVVAGIGLAAAVELSKLRRLDRIGQHVNELTAENALDDVRRLLIVDVEDGPDGYGTILAKGAQFPSGTIAVEWNRMAFEEDERTENAVMSQYGSVADAEEATGGTVRFVEGE
ncbi:hypothetical protein BRC71_06280 [Halobacteriales archaeon QH_7_65_31]|nr:MAG: hypothetical protein BRC71_06280 [Halobacteriales archaeon QH_7_65_31]